VGSGFILNLGNKKVGVRVRSNDDMHLWSQALLSVLAPGPKPISWALVQTAEFREPKKAAKSQKLRRDRSIIDVEPPERHRPKKMKRNSRGTVHVGIIEAHGPHGGRGLKMSTHKDGREATELVVGPSAKLLRYSSQPGSDYIAADLTEKVNIHEAAHPQPKLQLTEKVTGAYQSPSPRRRSVSPKITEGDRATLLERRSKSLTQKVNVEGRRSLALAKRQAARRDPSRSAKMIDSAEGRREFLQRRHARTVAPAPTGGKITE